MRVAMYYSNKDIRITEREIPKPGPGEAVMRIHASGICGSDVMEWYRKGKTPLVLGHEVAGDVVSIGEGGEGATTLKVGDRICAAHHVPCNTCHYCLNGHHTVCDTLRTTNFDPGGFAEFVRLPAINVDRGVFPLPDSVTYEEGSFIEPLACCYRGQRLAGIGSGVDKSVLVIGSGISGILHIALARAMGSPLIVGTDVSEYRLDAAKRFGAYAALHATDDVPAKFRALNGGRGADIVIVCAGAVTCIEQAVKSVERGGVVLFFAPAGYGQEIPLKLNDIFWKNEISFVSSYAANHFEHMKALELIETKRVPVKDMITHRLPLADITDGFRLVAEARDSIKVIIEPQK